MVRNGIDLLVMQPNKHIAPKLEVFILFIIAYETKAGQADQANQKVILKYEGLKKYIDVCGASDAQILAFIPKVQVSQFMEQNKKDFQELRNGAAAIKQKMDSLDKITSELKAFFTKMNFQ